MNKKHIIITVVAMYLLMYAPILSAHCDRMNGPVVKAAQNALARNDVNLVLIWVQKKDEAEVKTLFQKTLTVRKLGPEAKELADMYFFETVVRLHRAGEGAPFNGLKPPDNNPSPAILAVDKAIEQGSAEGVQSLLSSTVRDGISKHFMELMLKKNYDPKDVDAGREYIRNYVTFIHFAERLYQDAIQLPHGHFDESELHEENKE